MEEISVNGEKYLKASILAKKFGYTPDYLGQLCRSEQVTATLIGRSWYITEDSLVKHKQGRYRSVSAKSKEYLREAVAKAGQITPTVSVKAFKYEEDEGDLIPSLSKKEELVSVLEPIKEEPKKQDLEPNSESKIVIKTPVIRRPPPLRTIPNFQPVAPKEFKKQKALPVATYAQSSPRYRFATLALVVLVLEFMALYGAMGLEKRLITDDGNTAMVLYGFDTSAAQEFLTENFLY